MLPLCAIMVNFALTPDIGVMPSKPTEIPPAAARAFVRTVCANLVAGHNSIQADGIAARQLQALRVYQGPREKAIKLHEAKSPICRDEG